MFPLKMTETLIDMWTYAFLQWYYLVPNMMSRGTDADQWVSTFCMNGAKQLKAEASSSARRSLD